MLVSLKLAGPSKRSSASLVDLAAHVRERNWAKPWVHLLQTEHGYLIALARKLREERKAAYESPESVADNATPAAA